MGHKGVSRTKEHATRSFVGHNLSGDIATVTVTNGDYKLLLSLYMHITERCNYRCGHCYMGSNPEVKDTLSKSDIFGLADQLSEHKTRSILITGGEPFLHPDLDEIIAYLRTKKVGPIIIFTNGYWVDDFKKAKRRLKELRELGCEHIKFSINDQYHRAFMEEYKREIIKKIVRLNGKDSLPLLEMNSEKDEVDPKGSALALPEEKLGTYDRNNRFLFEKWDNLLAPGCELTIDYMLRMFRLHIRADGRVYPCSWFVKSIGNIKEQSLNEIINNLLSDGEYRLLSEKGPKELASRKGMPYEEMHAKFMRHPCRLCYDIFN